MESARLSEDPFDAEVSAAPSEEASDAAESAASSSGVCVVKESSSVLFAVEAFLSAPTNPSSLPEEADEDSSSLFVPA